MYLMAFQNTWQSPLTEVFVSQKSEKYKYRGHNLQGCEQMAKTSLPTIR